MQLKDTEKEAPDQSLDESFPVRFKQIKSCCLKTETGCGRIPDSLYVGFIYCFGKKCSLFVFLSNYGYFCRINL